MSIAMFLMQRVFRKAPLFLAMFCAVVSFQGLAEDRPTISFPADPPLSALLEKIPGTPVSVPWLAGTQVIRYDDTRLDMEKTMPLVRDSYEQWCKAQSGKIVQPRNNNCALLRKGLGCAVGELQQPGLGTDFERGLKSAAIGSGDKVEVAWPKASWVISNNALFNIFLNQGANQISFVGGLQRCVGDRGALIGAMAFVSINDHNDLLFLEPGEYDTLARRGAELNKALVERQQDEARQRKAQETAKIASLTPGSYVIHAKTGWRGMVIEMKPPLAQIQWDKFGDKALEWNRLEDLRPGVHR